MDENYDDTEASVPLPNNRHVLDRLLRHILLLHADFVATGTVSQICGLPGNVPRSNGQRLHIEKRDGEKRYVDGILGGSVWLRLASTNQRVRAHFYSGCFVYPNRPPVTLARQLLGIQIFPCDNNLYSGYRDGLSFPGSNIHPKPDTLVRIRIRHVRLPERGILSFGRPLPDALESDGVRFIGLHQSNRCH